MICFCLWGPEEFGPDGYSAVREKARKGKIHVTDFILSHGMLSYVKSH